MPAADSPPAPVVSVILPTYNWPSVLRHAIRSVLWQTFTEFELLVIGDGCTDDTAEVVAGFAEPRIHWDNLPANSGNQAAPNNRGLATARGEYVAYLHHDDLWLPGHLSALVKALEAGGDVAHTLTLEVGPPPEGIRRVGGLPNSGPLGADKVYAPTPSIMHRTDAARRIGGWREDWQSLVDPPDQDFRRRIIGPTQALITVP
jgi:glycosyltransferase involved in cell wall biosynthesis